MKGVVLAGVLRSWLSPLTRIANKHLLPGHDQPMIYCPIKALINAGIEDIMIVTDGAGVDQPMAVVVPKGVVHGYKNIGDIDGMVINCPNRLYMGEGKGEEIDEIRHEDDPNTPYRMD